MKTGPIRITVHIGAARIEWDENKGYDPDHLRVAVRAIAAMMTGFQMPLATELKDD